VHFQQHFRENLDHMSVKMKRPRGACHGARGRPFDFMRAVIASGLSGLTLQAINSRPLSGQQSAAHVAQHLEQVA
jgi:hypothetical protein